MVGGGGGEIYKWKFKKGDTFKNRIHIIHKYFKTTSEDTRII